MDGNQVRSSDFRPGAGPLGRVHAWLTTAAPSTGWHEPDVRRSDAFSNSLTVDSLAKVTLAIEKELRPFVGEAVPGSAAIVIG